MQKFRSNSKLAERPSTECWYQHNASKTTGRMKIQFVKMLMVGRILWENGWIDKECTIKVTWKIQITLWATERISSRNWSYTSQPSTWISRIWHSTSCLDSKHACSWYRHVSSWKNCGRWFWLQQSKSTKNDEKH